MNNKKMILCALATSILSINIAARLDQFGLSDIVPTKDDDNEVFDQRISEEMANGNTLTFHGRRTDIFTIQDILKFIQEINNAFEDYLNHADEQDAQELEDIKLAIIDVQKAKKMLQAKHVTPYEEHLLRAALGSITTKVNAYSHTDAIEGSSYIQE